MTPQWGENTVLFQQLPGLSIRPLLERLFELTLFHSRALSPSTSPCALLPELQRYNEPIRCVALGAEVPEHSKTTDTNLECVLAKNSHF